MHEEDLDALASQYDRVICPNSGCIIEPKHKTAMNLRGRWLADSQRIRADDRAVGTSMTSTIAGYWFGGVAAAYVVALATSRACGPTRGIEPANHGEHRPGHAVHEHAPAPSDAAGCVARGLHRGGARALPQVHAVGPRREHMPRKTKTAAEADKNKVQFSAEALEQLIPAPVTPAELERIFQQFKKAVLERALGSEMSHHLGYAPGEARPEGAPANHRNGKGGALSGGAANACRAKFCNGREGADPACPHPLLENRARVQ